MTETSEEPAPKIDLSFEQLFDLVGEASGWGHRVRISFRHQVNPLTVPHKVSVAASVEIAGCRISLPVVACGPDPRLALIGLLQNIEQRFRDIAGAYKGRCVGARALLDAHGISYVKGDL